MSYCSVCGCRVEPVPQPNVRGFVHACRHKHAHTIPWSISEKQRDELPGRTAATA